jgi:hypothetical protein
MASGSIAADPGLKAEFIFSWLRPPEREEKAKEMRLVLAVKAGLL